MAARRQLAKQLSPVEYIIQQQTIAAPFWFSGCLCLPNKNTIQGSLKPIPIPPKKPCPALSPKALSPA
ncbi:hypothetical protein [Kingella sp. (in: b-proteobacteria)]|uniref:hypothetical protein n=1 Tax=Kingella sp. (in: b-proteobacteria) TaxID=2020713 RepID=UPI0026DD735D|nr:hypothetical protein [Kingella sp. (in: b-proteobacteria)]MDO4658312.1 hypothetical protein [Kingella sp. (in: b-proteobacteria)]